MNTFKAHFVRTPKTEYAYNTEDEIAVGDTIRNNSTRGSMVVTKVVPNSDYTQIHLDTGELLTRAGSLIGVRPLTIVKIIERNGIAT